MWATPTTPLILNYSEAFYVFRPPTGDDTMRRNLAWKVASFTPTFTSISAGVALGSKDLKILPIKKNKFQ